MTDLIDRKLSVLCAGAAEAPDSTRLQLPHDFERTTAAVRATADQVRRLVDTALSALAATQAQTMELGKEAGGMLRGLQSRIDAETALVREDLRDLVHLVGEKLAAGEGTGLHGMESTLAVLREGVDRTIPAVSATANEIRHVAGAAVEKVAAMQAETLELCKEALS